ncbi:hypothetical protein HYU11_03425 [Candidatus Woesearchaeota archaeon]|nr:hypothetical protein [Candidatus Woesearchaeota archaeon]
MLKGADIRQWARSTSVLQHRFNDAVAWAFRKRTPLFAAIILLLAVFFLFSFLKQLFLIAFFIALGSASLFYNRFIKTSIGFELITLGVVVIGRLYGPFPAMVVGFFSLLFAELFAGSLQHKTIVSFAGIVTIGFLTQYFSAASITTEGIILVIIYNAIIIPGYILLGSSPLRSGLFLVTHLVFSFWLFSSVAPVVYRFLA